MKSKYKCILKYFLMGFIICLLLILICFKPDIFLKIRDVIFNVIEPFIYGFIIAYVINPLESFLEDRIPIKNKKCLRGILTIIIVALLIFLILASCGLIIPTIIESCKKFLDNLPTYIKNTYDSIRVFINNHADLAKLFIDNLGDLDERYTHIEDVITEASTQIQPYIQGWLKNLTNSIFNVVKIIKNLALGLIVAVYLILNKEMLRRQFRAVFKRVLNKKIYNILHTFLMNLNRIFFDFLVGKTLDSFIIFILSYIVFAVTGMPCVLLISTIIGVTNIIPCFGPIIGAIPSGIIIFMQKPDKLILFIILIIIIQQIDGNIIGVKILGGKLKLPSVWVFFAILIFGSLFGIWGMIIGVPTFAVLYSTVKEILGKKDLTENLNEMKEDEEINIK